MSGDVKSTLGGEAMDAVSGTWHFSHLGSPLGSFLPPGAPVPEQTAPAENPAAAPPDTASTADAEMATDPSVPSAAPAVQPVAPDKATLRWLKGLVLEIEPDGTCTIRRRGQPPIALRLDVVEETTIHVEFAASGGAEDRVLFLDKDTRLLLAPTPIAAPDGRAVTIPVHFRRIPTVQLRRRGTRR